MFRHLIASVVAASCILGSPGLQAQTYPAIPHWQPDAAQRENLRRSLSLLSTSTPAKRNTVKVLFYGQSITEQDWSRQVAQYLRETYTNANLIIENRAIGGHSSQLLVKTAEADLYPFQPDLLVFHVYGSHLDYETIIRNTRERTCADILMQTDHITQESSMTEEMDPAKLTPAQWDAWMNHAFLPTTAAKFGACRADIHELWKTYLDANDLKPAKLLKDTVHLNAHGDWLMAHLLEPYLAPLPAKPNYDPYNDTRVHTVAPHFDGASAKVEFEGNRCDLIFKPGATESVEVRIDGKKPSEIAALYGFTRVSAFPQSNWPLLLKVGSQAPLAAETWSLKIDQVTTNGTCHFVLNGSSTGDDGEGMSTNKFVSKSGRVTIEPGDWNLKFCLDVFKRPLPEGHVATWHSVLRGMDLAQCPKAADSVESTVTLAQGLASGKHVVELTGARLQETVQAIRTYYPQGK